jgi:mannosyltransferase
VALAAALAVAAVALALGLWHLGAKSLAPDEGVSVAASSGQIGSAGHVISVEPNLALYYGFLHLWQLVGASEFWLRLPSALSLAAAALLTAVVTTRVFGRPAGPIAALVVAINPFALEHAQQLRPYAIAIALAAATTLLFLSAVEGPTARRWTAWAALSVFSVLAHPYAAFVLVAQLLSLALLPPDRVPRRAAMLATLGTAAALIPLTVLLIASPSKRIAWIPSPGLAEVWSYAVRLAGGEVVLVGCLTLAGIAVASTVVAARRARHRTVDTWRVGLIVLWLVTPFVLGLIASLAQPLLLARYVLVSLPALAALAAAGLVRLRMPVAILGVVVALVALQFDNLRDYYRQPSEGWRSAAAVIADRAAPGDQVVVYPLGTQALAYHLDRFDSPVTTPPAREPILAGSSQPSLDPAARIWLVVRHTTNFSPPLTAPLAALRRQRMLGRRWSFHEVAVMLYEPERS